jgi:crotonobetainyl-CoA:carnitine CoA-transferase CaiB-like acyl-CoA transferase
MACADGDVILVVGSATTSSIKLCDVLGASRWAQCAVQNNVMRVRIGVLMPILRACFLPNGSVDLIEALDHFGVPCGAINGVVFEDPQVHARHAQDGHSRR